MVVVMVVCGGGCVGVLMRFVWLGVFGWGWVCVWACRVSEFWTNGIVYMLTLTISMSISAVVGMFFPYRHVEIIGSRRRHACRHNLSFKVE